MRTGGAPSGTLAPELRRLMSAADSSAIVISVSGEEREVTAKTAAELFADDPKIVVARVNGVLVDLSHECLLATPLSRFSFTNRTA